VPDRLGERFDDALVYAVDLHRGQPRKGRDVPYASHLLGVTSLVIEEGGTEDQAITALLHDAVEDQGGMPTLLDIRARFGDHVGDLVEACTDSLEDPPPPWRERKEAYIAHLPDAPRDALLVSVADKVHNARSILIDLRSEGPSVFERFSGKREGVLWYYRTLVTTYRAIGYDARLVDLLDRIVTELERLAGAPVPDRLDEN
jgi:(p)ppGpp synthase/HD superfamily hydrolase